MENMAFWNRTNKVDDRGDPEVAAFCEEIIAKTPFEPLLTLLQDHAEDIPPRDGAGREAWIRDRVHAAFSLKATRQVYQMTDALADLVHERLRHPDRLKMQMEQATPLRHANEMLALAICARHVSLLRTGGDMVRRIDDEAAMLDAVETGLVAKRLVHTPPARMDRIPTDQARRRAWLRDMLIGEAAAIHAGRMTPRQIAEMAAASLLRVEHRREPGDPPIDMTPPHHHDDGEAARIEMQVTNLAGQTDEALMARFGIIPGCTPPPPGHEERIRWIRLALKVEAVRRRAGLAMANGEARPVSVTIENVVVMADGGFSATLHVDGQRICALSSPGGGDIDAGEWTEGCSAADLDALDAYICATGMPRDEGETPDGLILTILDLVSTEVVLKDLRHKMRSTLIFWTEMEGEQAILSIAIPEGGSKEGAREAMLAAHPRAVALEDMPEEDAALLWITLVPPLDNSGYPAYLLARLDSQANMP